MSMSVGGSNRGIFVEMNVVPLIDVLLVLLVIFMIIPHKQKGLMAELPQPAPPDRRIDPQPSVIVAVSAPHREDAFEGARAAIDQVAA